MASLPRAERRERVAAYLEVAAHLDAAQRAALQEGRPFRGMTLAEASLAMQLEAMNVEDDGELLHGRYRGGDGEPYHVYFDARSQTVVFWSAFAFEDVELPDIEDYRPQPPLPLPGPDDLQPHP